MGMDIEFTDIVAGRLSVVRKKNKQTAMTRSGIAICPDSVLNFG